MPCDRVSGAGRVASLSALVAGDGRQDSGCFEVAVVVAVGDLWLGLRILCW